MQTNAGSSSFGYIFTIQVALICYCANKSFKCSLVFLSNGQSDNFQKLYAQLAG